MDNKESQPNYHRKYYEVLMAFFLVPFMTIWSGFSLGGIYGSQLVSGEFNLFTSLFGIPFLLGSILFWSFTLMTIGGKVELTLDKFGGKVFTGVGSIGITKKFVWSEVSSVKESINNVKYPGNKGTEILLEGKKRISFGSGINEDRKYYVIKALKVILSKVKSSKNIF